MRYGRKMIVYLRWLLRTHKAPSDEGAVAKRLRERKCSVFFRVYQEFERFQPFSPPVSFADSIHLGMIATGNHEYFDSLRGAPPSSEGALEGRAKNGPGPGGIAWTGAFWFLGEWGMACQVVRFWIHFPCRSITAPMTHLSRSVL